MDESLVRAWLTLLRAPGLGINAIEQLLAHYPDPVAVVNAGAAACQVVPGLGEAARKALLQPDEALIEGDLCWLERPGNHLVTRDHPHYPELLREIPRPPMALFVVGDPARLALPQLAIVGSRNPTPAGASAAHDFARHLAAGGFAVTSGLAIGIDAHAHQGALDAKGVTVAVTGTGLDRVYPARNRDLARHIAEGGVLVSEFPPGTAAKASHFPMRNRIIAGLSLGTLVVEAALRSGSLITARMAGEYGGEIFAIPGSIHNPLARGCHALIRQGAKLVETAGDIIEELGGMLSHVAQRVATEARGVEPEGDEARVLQALGHDTLGIDELVGATGLTPAELSSMLLTLELRGLVAPVAGGRYCRRV